MTAVDRAAARNAAATAVVVLAKLAVWGLATPPIWYRALVCVALAATLGTSYAAWRLLRWEGRNVRPLHRVPPMRVERRHPDGTPCSAECRFRAQS